MIMCKGRPSFMTGFIPMHYLCCLSYITCACKSFLVFLFFQTVHHFFIVKNHASSFLLKRSSPSTLFDLSLMMNRYLSCPNFFPTIFLFFFNFCYALVRTLNLCKTVYPIMEALRWADYPA